jgi:citrate lyase subunit beta / citryl-CoA lyase
LLSVFSDESLAANSLRSMKVSRAVPRSRRRTGSPWPPLIHPSQVGPCNEIFSPTEEEVFWSRKIIVAFKQPENAKKGVIVVDGRMVERLHLGMAERTVQIAEQIREMETACT